MNTTEVFYSSSSSSYLRRTYIPYTLANWCVTHQLTGDLKLLRAKPTQAINKSSIALAVYLLLVVDVANFTQQARLGAKLESKPRNPTHFLSNQHSLSIRKTSNVLPTSLLAFNSRLGHIFSPLPTTPTMPLITSSNHNKMKELLGNRPRTQLDAMISTVLQIVEYPCLGVRYSSAIC